VPVKRGLGQHAADGMHPDEAHERLQRGASQAMRSHATTAPASVPQPLRLEVDLHQPRTADLAALLSGLTRSGRTGAFDAETMTAAYGMLHVIAALTQNGP
jgi:D-amino peptidase